MRGEMTKVSSNRLRLTKYSLTPETMAHMELVASRRLEHRHSLLPCTMTTYVHKLGAELGAELDILDRLFYLCILMFTTPVLRLSEVIP